MPSRQLQEDFLLPRSFALRSIDELRDWAPSDTDIPHIASVPLKTRKTNQTMKPRLLLTHDMAGGYKEDANVQGNMFKDIYFIQRWHFVDIFNYFSHERVSIPPVNWINTCHRNGVKCLGTFLVEGNNQMHEMEALLHGPPFINDEDNDPMQLWEPFYADKLVAIAKRYNFDGWLINIECEFFSFPTNPRFKAQELAKFIGYLTNKMHEEIPGSQVVWYDSMIETGEINYQNQLTHLNGLFFKNADGIFINYWWEKEYPEMTRRTAERYGKLGYDVYFGTDVWGRGTFGGGGFNSYRSIKTATLAQTSSALFGMAWTYENFDKADFEKMDRLFWSGGSYSEYPPMPPSDPDLSPESEDSDEEGVSRVYHKGIEDAVSMTEPVPGDDWFATSFDKGFGIGFYHEGKRLLSQPWSHLSHQSILPNLRYHSPVMTPADNNIKLTCSLENELGAFIGGTSLLLKGQRLTHRESRDLETEVSVPLYKLELDVSKGCFLRYVYRALAGEDARVVMSCQLTLQSSNFDTLDKLLDAWLPNTFLLDPDDGLRTTVSAQSEGYLYSRCCVFPVVKEDQGENDWIIKLVYIPPISEGIKLSLNQVEMNVLANAANLVGIQPHLIACLGHLSILPSIDESNVLKETQNHIDQMNWSQTKTKKITNAENEQTMSFFGTLHWQQQPWPTNHGQSWKRTDYYLIFYEAPEKTHLFLGTAFCTQYRISGLACKNSQVEHRIVIKAVDVVGNIGAQAYTSIPL
ncbi:glycosyl hydrolase family 85-domain-containing protein [Blakeslea trispora]|nr:glycosyl hydrolase family 85-domain-containing protein [Blakeslea trispora]